MEEERENKIATIESVVEMRIDGYDFILPGTLGFSPMDELTEDSYQA